MFHPLDGPAIQRFVNSDVSHRGRPRRAVPMLLVRREPDHIARPDFLDRFALALRPAKTGGDDQRLAEWMCMPRGARTWLERDTRCTRACRFRRLKQRIDTHRTGKPVTWSLRRT
jgi:hypothetical protein